MSNFLYTDASTLVSVTCADSRGQQALRLLKKYNYLITSVLSEVETQAGIVTQAKGDLQLQVTLEDNAKEVFERFQIAHITEAVIAQATVLIRRYRAMLQLRPLDAIHVATAQEVKMQLAKGQVIDYLTSDQRQSRCFLSEGFRGTCLD